MKTMRQLTPEERQALLALAQGMEINKKDRFLSDVEDCSVEEATSDGSRLVFHLANYQRPPYRGQHAYLVEGSLKDSDDTDISVLLHADENDRVLELELIKWGEARIVGPNWETFKVLY